MRVRSWREVVPRLRRVRRALSVWLAWLNGDAEYQAYCAHLRTHHADVEPLSRAAFYVAELERRWNGVRRCC